MSQFKIIAGDKKEYGPVSIEEVGRWIQQGRANGDTRVQAEGESDWVPLREVPVLAVLLGGQTPQPSAGPPVLGSAPLTADQLMAELQGRPHTFSVGECFSRGWRLLMDNFGLLLLTAIGCFFLIVVASFIPFGGLIVAGPLLGGAYYIFLKRLRSEPADFGELFDGFKFSFMPLLLAYVFMILVTIPAIIPMVLALIIGAVGGAIEAETTGGFPFISVILSALGYLISVLLMNTLVTMFGMTVPLVMDRKMEATEAFKATWRVTKHCWGKFMLLSICVFLMNFVGLVALCLGMLVTIPLSMAMGMVAYEKLFGRAAQA